VENKINVNDLARSCNEILVLALLSKGRLHGYQLALELEERSGNYFRLTYGTIYPLMHKLEKQGYIKGEWEVEETQRKRKFYKLTSAGQKHLEKSKMEWLGFFEHLVAILGG